MPAFRTNPRAQSAALESHVLRDNPRLSFDPRKLDTDLLVWARSDLGTIMNDSTVSAWADYSGGGNGFAQGTASNQPTLNVGGLGGRPELFFDGSDDHMDGASPFGMITAKDSWTIVVVCGNGWTYGGSSGNFYQGRMIFGGSGSGAAWPSLGCSAVVGNQPRGGFWNGAINPTCVTHNITAGEPFILALIDDSGDMFGRLNGEDGATYSSAGSIQSIATGFTLGKGPDLVSAQWDWWNAGVSEMLVFDGALDEVQLGNLDTYLGDRYGIQL